MSAVRLQKILSSAGVASRRAAEELIRQGRVTLNGQTVTELGTKADPSSDEVRVDGRRVRGIERRRYLLLNKPKGYMTTRSDPRRRPTVMDLVPGVREYIYPVGRLDFDSSGLLLLTNDGDLAAALTHPSHEIEREYHAWVLGTPDGRDLERLRHGIIIEGRRTAPARVEVMHEGRGPRRQQVHLRFVLREGRNRQVRRMCEAVGHPVVDLTRVRFGPIADAHLGSGAVRELTPDEVRRLIRAAGRNPPGAKPDRKPAQKRGADRRSRRPAR
jgi:23S rRNA pseudouridine2605 synthase